MNLRNPRSGVVHKLSSERATGVRATLVGEEMGWDLKSACGCLNPRKSSHGDNAVGVRSPKPITCRRKACIA